MKKYYKPKSRLDGKYVERTIFGTIKPEVDSSRDLLNKFQ